MTQKFINLPHATYEDIARNVLTFHGDPTITDWYLRDRRGWYAPGTCLYTFYDEVLKAVEHVLPEWLESHSHRKEALQ